MFRIEIFIIPVRLEVQEPFRTTEPVVGKQVHALSFSPSGGQVLAVSADGQARIYDRDGPSQWVQGAVDA